MQCDISLNLRTLRDVLYCHILHIGRSPDGIPWSVIWLHSSFIFSRAAFRSGYGKPFDGRPPALARGPKGNKHPRDVFLSLLCRLDSSAHVNARRGWGGLWQREELSIVPIQPRGDLVKQTPKGGEGSARGGGTFRKDRHPSETAHGGEGGGIALAGLGAGGKAKEAEAKPTAKFTFLPQVLMAGRILARLT
eukprot:394757-Amorphochlora_amoeboformis.AAC.1